jgi:hypothetical protein|tara:strand:+ start:7523 stop:7753 length:231 start_codon:yes stop_codon:yes gene_type:complete
MDIRKISVGADYKSSAMHYIVNQEIFNGNYYIHLIKHISESNSIKVWIENKQGEIFLWKEFNSNMPVSIEYNINFE